MPRKGSPKDDDMQRMKENLYRNKGHKIKDRESYDKAYLEYFKDGSDKIKTPAIRDEV